MKRKHFKQLRKLQNSSQKETAQAKKWFKLWQKKTLRKEGDAADEEDWCEQGESSEEDQGRHSIENEEREDKVDIENEVVSPTPVRRVSSIVRSSNMYRVHIN